MTVTVDQARADLRQAGDALPRASIGTVPILWYNAADGDRWEPPDCSMRSPASATRGPS